MNNTTRESTNAGIKTDAVIDAINSLPSDAIISHIDFAHYDYRTGGVIECSRADLKAIVAELLILRRMVANLTRPINEVARDWEVHHTVSVLAEAADHLLHAHDCDGSRHEEYSIALEAARMWLGIYTEAKERSAAGEK